jgi:hypothetical protein
MQTNLSSVVNLFADTLRDPNGVATRIKSQRWPHDIGWSVMFLGIIAVVLLLHLEAHILGSARQMRTVAGAPFIDVITLSSLSVLTVFIFYFMGRAMGGVGTFGATLALMAWFQIVVLILFILQVLAGILVPFLAGLIAVISIVIQIFCLIHFLNTLHDFDNLFKAIGLFVLSIFGLGFGLAIFVLLISGAATVGV